MHRLIPAGCVLALSLSVSAVSAQDTPADNPAVRKLDRDIPRHKEFLRRIETSKGAGDVIFLGDSITHGWENQSAWQEHFGSFKPVNLGIGGDQTGHVLWRITDGHELDQLKPKAAVLMIGTAESLALGAANGLDPVVLSEIMRRSSGGNWALEVYNPWPGVMENAPASRGYTGGFMAALMTKDLGLAQETAQVSGNSTPMGSLALALYRLLVKQGHGEQDFSVIQKLFDS